MKPHKSKLEQEIRLDFELVKQSSDSDIVESDVLEQKLKDEATSLSPEKAAELEEELKDISGTTTDVSGKTTTDLTPDEIAALAKGF